MLLVAEPEAAAIYTARFLKESNGGDFLKVCTFPDTSMLFVIYSRHRRESASCYAMQAAELW